MIGECLGPYRLTALLGAGGMGRVFAAETTEAVGDLAPGARVAVKVVHDHLLADPRFAERFLQEAELGGRVRHENVVHTFETTHASLGGREVRFLVMELVEGNTLRALLEEVERAPEALCRHVGTEVARGLAAIHAAGAVHRDLKPENVIITPEHRVKIMDLGVARLVDAAVRLSQSGAFVGSLQYAAPEQFHRGGAELDGRADLHAVGGLLYEMAVGRHPFPADDVPGTIERILRAEPERLRRVAPRISPFLEEVVRTLLAKDRNLRFPSAEVLATVLADGEDGPWWSERCRELHDARPTLARPRIRRETGVHGREDELSRMEQAFRHAAKGDGRALLVTGEAGIGKTRLVDEFVARLETAGEDVQVLLGAYPPGGAATAAGALSAAYREYFGAQGLEGRLVRHLPQTPLLVPALAAVLRGEPPPEGAQTLARDGLQTVFVHVTRSLARERTTVVIVEDLHLAPQDGRAIFAALASAAAGHRILLIGTARPELAAEWAAQVDRLEQTERMALQRLGAKDLARLIEEALRSQRLADELGMRVARKSDGNPFFVLEILRGLREENLLERDADGSYVRTREIREIRIPSSVADLIAARLDVLSEDDRQILDVAACCGFTFDPRTVAAVLGMPDIPLLRRLALMERRERIVRSAGRAFEFDHHQVRDTLHAALPELLRERYHAAIAEEMLRHAGDRAPGGSDAVDLCEHLLAGGEAEQALAHLDEALDHLESGYVNDRAVALAERVLAEPGLLEGARRAGYQLRRIGRLEFLGRVDAEREALEEALREAEAGDDPVTLARVRAALGWLFCRVGRAGEGRALLVPALRAVRRAGEDGLACSFAGRLGNVYWTLGRVVDAERLYGRQLRLARRLDDPISEAAALGSLGNVYKAESRWEKAQRCYEESMALFERAGDRRGLAVCTGNLGNLHVEQGHSEEALGLYERHLELSRAIGYRRGEAIAIGNLGLVQVRRGCLADALARYEEQMALSRDVGDRLGEAVALENVGGIENELGRPERAEVHLRRTLEICREIGEQRVVAYSLQGLGEAALQRGDLERAGRLLRQALEGHQTAGNRPGTASTLLGLGGLSVREGDPAGAIRRLEEAERMAWESGTTQVAVLAAAQRARLPGGDLPRAEALLAEHAPRMSHRARLESHLLLARAGDVAGDVDVDGDMDDGSRAALHRTEAAALLAHLLDHAPPDARTSTAALYRDD